MIGYFLLLLFVTLCGYILGHRRGWRLGSAHGWTTGQEAVRIREEQVAARRIRRDS